MDKIELIFWMDFGIFEWVQTEIVNCGAKWCAGTRGPNKELSYPRCWWGQVIKQLFSLMEIEENCLEIIDCEKPQNIMVEVALTLSSYISNILSIKDNNE